MAAQEDPTPWISTDTTDETNFATSSLNGREDFSRLGIVRRKPGRGDAPRTLSKSCSDKLALKQCTSLLSSPTALLVLPRHAYLSSLVLPISRLSVVACERAFATSGRMKTVSGRTWTNGYKFSPFNVLATSREFHYSKQAVGDRASKIAPSNAALVWSCSGLHDRLVGGVKEGRRKADSKCESRVSRRSLWKLSLGALAHGLADLEESQGTSVGDTYENFKNHYALEARRLVKADIRSLALPNWQRNTGDDQFCLTGK
jgi:tRNA-specific adenosine deaminase 1